MTLKKPTHQIVATVLGAGTMGAGIAAHLAAAGCRVHLLDIVPPGTEDDAPVAKRSSIALAALKRLPKAKPPALMSGEAALRIQAGNLSDDLDQAAEASDLIVEAVVERLDVKQELFGRLAAACRPDAILATNTSGIPIAAIAEALPEAARAQLLGLHFFNPPRWMHLLEVIPSRFTSDAVVAEATRFCDEVLGKGTVLCRDTPNFIGNRIGIVEMLLTFKAAAKAKLTVEEIDFLNGPLVGHPKTGSCRLGDLVGLDVLGHVVRNLQTGLSSDSSSPDYDYLHSEMALPAPIEGLIADRRLGDKSGAGFYKKTTNKDGKRQILSVDLQSLEYRDRVEPEFEELARSIKLLTLEDRVHALVRRGDRAGTFAEQVLLSLANYAAHLVGQICDSPAEIDSAMRDGYGWQLGPLQLIDAVGISWAIERLRERGEPIAPLLEHAAASETGRLYSGSSAAPIVSCPDGATRPVPAPPGAILLSRLRETKTIHENASAALVDIGDGIACLEFRSKANILDDGVVQMIGEAPEWLAQRGYQGLVLGNQDAHFCRGANLMHIAGLIAQKDFDGVEQAVLALQQSFMALRHGPIPVVAAPLGQTLGGGTEAALHCAAIQAGADLFLGLVEIAVGVLPAGGGLKEIARRGSVWASQVPEQDPYPWVRRGFEAVASAKVSGSAFEARDSGFLSSRDRITFHRQRVLGDAKSQALGLAASGWQAPPRDEPIRVIGAQGGANLLMGVKTFGWGGFASQHDELIGRKIVHVLSGGMAPTGATRTATELLDLEREAFVSLCGEAKTFERIQHMLTTRKPLRN